MSWWEQGIEKPLDSGDKPQGGDGPWRFYLKKDQSKKVVFCDDTCFRFKEHALKIGGNYHNFFTCIRDNCPICPTDKAYLAGAFTVADMVGYTDSDGKIQGKGKKYLLVAKYYTLELLQKLYAKCNGLVGKVFDASRTSAGNAPNVGNIWIPEGKTDLSKLPDAAPFDYKTILAPKTVEEMKQAVGVVEPSDDSSGFSSTPSQETPVTPNFTEDDDLIPF